MRDQVIKSGPILALSGNNVLLVHQSARDYLLREGAVGNFVLEAFRIEPEKAHLDTAGQCLNYLEHSCLQYRDLRGVDFRYLRHRDDFGYAQDHSADEALALKQPLLDYAIHN